MAWLTALIKAILEWVTDEIKKDTKASDADATPTSLKNKWRERINKQLAKQNNKKGEPNEPELDEKTSEKTGFQSSDKNDNDNVTAR